MYANTPEAAEHRVSVTFGVLQREIGSCREWLPEHSDRCNEPSEYVLWGKLIKPEGLGPRCYDHAKQYIGHHGLYPESGYALIHLGDLARKIDREHFPGAYR